MVFFSFSFPIWLFDFSVAAEKFQHTRWELVILFLFTFFSFFFRLSRFNLFYTPVPVLSLLQLFFFSFCKLVSTYGLFEQTFFCWKNCLWLCFFEELSLAMLLAMLFSCFRWKWLYTFWFSTDVFTLQYALNNYCCLGFIPCHSLGLHIKSLTYLKWLIWVYLVTLLLVGLFGRAYVTT